MSKITNYTTISRIVSKYKRDLDLKKISITDIVEWTGEALEFIGMGNEMNAVSFLNVKNYEAPFPDGLVKIKGMLYDSEYTGADDCFVVEKKEIEEELPSRFSEPKCLDSCGNLVDEESWITYSRPFIRDAFRQALDMLTRVEFHNLSNSRFKRITASYDPMFNALYCYDSFKPCDMHYVIKENKTFNFSFEEGQVVLAYTYYPTDSKGYPMIPDDISFTTAITAYITFKMTQADFYNYVPGSQSRMQLADRQWQWYCKQASNKVMMPDEDEWNEINDSWKDRNNKNFYGRLGFRPTKNN